MERVVVRITEEGAARFLVSEETKALVEGEYDAVSKRASWVEPVSMPLRWVFHALRTIFGDYGLTAKFTRRWPCLWRVNLSPIGGVVLPKKFRNRECAIRYEIDYLNETFI